MSFIEVADRVVELLRTRGRITYRALKREFNVDDDFIEDLKEELIDGQELAVDKDGKVLVWTGGKTPQETVSHTTDAPAQSSQPEREAPAGERRQLTVMFCDLVGSTALSEQIDPEELQTVVRTYQEVSAQVIERYEGYIAQYLGDGLLVYFGYPAAHEDDAARAIRAGLEIVTALSQERSQFPQPVQVRIGIHTGPVVVGQMGGGSRHEQLALGETPNIAARVQGKAEPDEVVISAATQRLVAGQFETEDRGRHELKGISTLLPLYRVKAESPVQSRFEVAVQTGLTPLVGRDPELDVLHERWAQAQAGAGQVVLLSGEPGIGKSRLVQELKAQVTGEGATQIEFRCSPYHLNSTLYPVTEHLQRLSQFAPADTPETKLAKLQQLLGRYRFPQTDTLPLLAALLSLSPPDDVPALTVSPQKQKEQTQAALVAWLLEETERQPVYASWEDLHWADPSTLEVLELLLSQVPTVRLLAVLTFRPEFVSRWGTRSYLSQLTLSRLDHSHIASMVGRVTGGKPLPEEVVEQIVARTDGVPLFVEELTKMVVESDLVRAVNSHYELTGPLPPLAIPSTLHDSLMARLDRLTTAKEVAQLGATIGREFSYALLLAVSPLAEERLQHGLQQLVEAELVHQRGLPPQAHYLFRHALIQDTAYQSLLKSNRQKLHQQVAHVLEEQFAETVEIQPELVAHHYTEAGLAEQAISYWQKAGQRAIQRSANTEAIGHLTKGLALLKTRPETSERAQPEITLQVTLGVALIATKGYAAPEVEKVYARARELCWQLGDPSLLSRVLGGLEAFYFVRGDLRTARELGEQLLSLAESGRGSTLFLKAHTALGLTLFHLGEFTVALEHLEQGIALHDSHGHRSRALQDPGVVFCSYAALTLWHLGYADQAQQRISQALAGAQELSHSYSLALALYFSTWVHQFRWEARAAQERAEATVALSTEQGFSFLAALGAGLLGWALSRQGHAEEGIARIRQGLVALRETGAELFRPWFLALLAEASARAGQVDEGLAVVAEALAVVNKNRECIYEAELHRLKGELTMQSNGLSLKATMSEAEACFHQALEVARHQEAKSLELRAATSLARLWQQKNKKEEARDLLAPVYNWFTEGFDTADLKDAKALLEELS